MSDTGLGQLGKANEEEFFNRKNQEALERIKRNAEIEAMLSPVSGEPMKHSVMSGVVVHSCEQSGGIWVSGTELVELLKIQNESIEWDSNFFAELTRKSSQNPAHGKLKVAKEDEGKRLSPLTREPMEKFELEGVVLDRCGKSGGIWFDASELDAVLEASKNAGGDLKTWVTSFFKSLTK